MKRARQLGTHTREEWLALIEEFDRRCVFCGTSDRNLEKDHIHPVYDGGSDSIDNIQPACATCNGGKGANAFNWKEYRRSHGFHDAIYS